MPIGPQLPPHLAASSSKPASEPSDDGEDDFGPALPPELAAKRANVGPQLPSAGPSRLYQSPSPPRIVRAPGPSVPGPAPPPVDDDSDDDYVGPRLDDIEPVKEKSAAEEFREREARLAARRSEEASKPSVQKRDDWMLAPPPTGALASLDPTKRPTTFQKSNRPGVTAKEQAVWTETPAERAQREKNEMLGIKRGHQDDDGDDAVEKRRKREKEEAIRNQIKRHTVSLAQGDAADRPGEQSWCVAA